MNYRITARGRDGGERPVHFEPDTLEACAAAMEAHTCGNRRDAAHALRTLGSYSASAKSGAMLRAEGI